MIKPKTTIPTQRRIVIAAPLLALLPLLLSAPNRAAAQTGAAQTGAALTVTPVAAPIPLPGTTPVAPEMLRRENPASVLPMTGVWRFSLIHGHIAEGGVFVPRPQQMIASSEENANTANRAFDGDPATRWCASGKTFPQWVQANLGTPRVVRQVDLAWEKADDHYQFRIEGSDDGRIWRTLADRTALPGVGDGPVPVAATQPVRYLRVTVAGIVNSPDWASVRECRITVAGPDGAEAVWKPRADGDISDAERDAFAAPDFPDGGWDNLAVPSNWEMAGYSIPTYNSVDDTVGLYRRTVAIPASFAGKRVYWRFDGVLEGAEIWVNGHRAGYHESGYTAFDVDVTDLIQPGAPNHFALRVSKTAPSVDCETGDFQCMGGIYRENYLIAVPPTHVQTLELRTTLDAAYHDATLSANLTLRGEPGQTVRAVGTLYTAKGESVPVTGLTATAEIGADGSAVCALSASVGHPKLWSAEKPALYYLVVSLAAAGKPVGERVEQRFGFRQVEIKNGVVLWNGQPIKCAGVCRHDFWADKGFALTDVEWRKDLMLMRAANVNAIRTSHYNHATRFLEMCDEMGFYVLDEVPFCWINEHFSDPAFTPYLLQRASETVARDHNLPCVLAWSIGNENGFGKDGQAVIDRVTALDPTRPAFVSQMWSGAYKGQAFRDSHYPSPDAVAGLVSGGGGNTAPANFSENPHTYYQKEAHEYDPGVADLWGEALQNAWNLIWPQPTILGSFIWEWQNQGIADRFPDKTREFWYGPDFLRQENNKGIVDAFRNPKPEWWYVHEVYSPVRIDARTVQPTAGVCVVPLENRYSFTDLNELTCKWAVLDGERVLTQGTQRVACAPGKATDAKFAVPPSGMTAVRIEFLRADGTSVIAATLPRRDLAPTMPPLPIVANAPVAVEETADQLRVSCGGKWSTIVFDKSHGRIASWTAGKRVLLTGGPILNLGEARARGTDAPKDYLYGPEPPTVEQSTLRWTRTAEGVRVTTTGEVHAGSGDHGRWGSLFVTYTIDRGGSLKVAWKFYWSADNAHAWECGLKFTAPKDLTQLRWSRTALFADYPADHLSAASGVCVAGEERFATTKRDLHFLTLTDSAHAGLAICPDGSPLDGRALPGKDGITVFADSETAGPRGLSYEYIADRDIALRRDGSVGGSLLLYPVGMP